MNEKVKKILKIFGIWYGISFTLSALWCILMENSSLMHWDKFLSALTYCVLTPLCLLFGPILAFSPAIIILYFLFKKVKNVDARVTLVAFLIPFTNLVYYVIGHCFNETFEFISMLIGISTLVMFLPTALIVTLCTPKSLLPQKLDFIFANILTGIFGFGLMFCALCIGDYISDRMEQVHLNKYEPIIQQLEEFKTKNGLYPDTIEDTVKIYDRFSYEPQDDGKNYKLTVYNRYTVFYSHCSDENIDGCRKGWYHHMKHRKIGSWTKAVDDD